MKEKVAFDGFLRWIHISAVVFGLGGVGFALNVLFPSMAVLSPDQAGALSAEVFPRFGSIAWTVMASIVITAVLMVAIRWPIDLKSTYGKVLGVKIVLASLWTANNISVLLGKQPPTALWYSFILGIVLILLGASLTKLSVSGK